MEILFTWASLIIAAYLLFLFYLIRIEVAYRNQNIILDAIYAYTMDELSKNRIAYPSASEICNHMEEYDSTINRWWDFGYTRILPKEYFELVKPFIKKKERKK